MTAVADLPLPADVVAHYRERGITELYPPQAAAVEAGLCAGRSIVAALPTASGKTLLAELAMQSADGTALYIVPLRALAREKAESFGALPGVDVAVATGDLDAEAAGLADADVVVATSEKVDSLVRSDADWVARLGCVVVDEVHLVDQPDRGPTLEMVVATLRRLRPDLQWLALSATVANPGALADWLDAEAVVSTWRPVELRRGVHYDDQVAYHAAPVERVPVPPDCDAATALVTDTLSEGAQALVFVHSRRAAESLAADLAGAEATSPSPAATAVRASAETGTGRALAEALAGGAAFHHAGLRTAHRGRVEAAFRARELGVVVATPTLAAGVNLPARRVVVRDTERWTGDGWTPLPVLEVHQMFGRAGRPGLDPHGEAVLVAEDHTAAGELHERYLEGEPEAVTSSLATQDALRTHVLAAVAGGVAGSRAELVGVLEATFYAVEEDPTALVDVADLVLEYLVAEGMVQRDADGLHATPFGETVSRQYVDPRTAVRFRGVLDRVADRDRLDRLTVLVTVCDADRVPTPYLAGDDQGRAHRFAVEHETALLVDLDDFEGDYTAWLETVKAVQVLAARLDGADEATIEERFGVGPGDLRATAERAVWLTGALAAIARHHEHPHAAAIEAVRDALEERAGPEAGEGGAGPEADTRGGDTDPA